MGSNPAEQTAFFARTAIDGECIIYTGTLDPDGYGLYFFRGVTRRANRVAWFLENGEIPDGMVVSPTCGNRACVSPQHLQLRARSDLSRAANGNARKTTCPEGHPYDATVTHGGKTQRVCTRCRNAKRAAAKRRRYAEAKKLRV